MKDLLYIIEANFSKNWHYMNNSATYPTFNSLNKVSNLMCKKSMILKIDS